MTFDSLEELYAKEMLPAECDDECVKVGMRICWDAATLAERERCAKIAENEYLILCNPRGIAKAIREG